MKALGKLNRIDLRDHWEDEARSFTPWLALEENLGLLGEAIGLELELEGTEQSIGPFKVDILAKESGTDDTVIIENQLERTDHDHLGKLITYASGYDAKAIVWVAREITEEHQKALEWLNEITGNRVSFFGLEIELWQIADSPPAPKFNLVCRPNEWAKTLSAPASSRDLSESKLLRLDFWTEFAKYCQATGTFLKLRKPNHRRWYSFAVGRSRFSLSLIVQTRSKQVGCQLYIRHLDAKRAFDQIATEKDSIEKAIGASLEWHRPAHSRDCRIVQLRAGDIENRSSWPELFDWMKDRAEAFHQSFSARVRSLDLEDEELEVEARAEEDTAEDSAAG